MGDQEIRLTADVLGRVESRSERIGTQARSDSGALRSGVPAEGFGPLGTGLTQAYDELGSKLADQADQLATVREQIASNAGSTRGS